MSDTEMSWYFISVHISYPIILLKLKTNAHNSTEEGIMRNIGDTYNTNEPLESAEKRPEVEDKERHTDAKMFVMKVED